MRQTTFADIKSVQSIEQLSAKQVSIVRLLATGATQGMISRQMRISRASVSQTCRFLEDNNLIKKEIGTRYNIIYSISAELHKRIGGSTERLSACRVHNVSLKFAVIAQDHPLTKDKRSGYTKSWMMRGGERNAYWFPGKAGEISCTVTVHPRTIVIRMDAKQKILAASVEDAEQRGFQHLIHIRQKFIEAQRLFGVNIEIEPTGKRIGKVHYGFPIPEQHAAANEVLNGEVPKWFGDRSLDELGQKGLVEGETTYQSEAKKMERALNFPDIFPKMISDAINPIGADVTQVKAMMMGEVTMQRQYEQMMKFMTAAMTEIQTLRKEVQGVIRITPWS